MGKIKKELKEPELYWARKWNNLLNTKNITHEQMIILFSDFCNREVEEFRRKWE